MRTPQLTTRRTMAGVAAVAVVAAAWVEIDPALLALVVLGSAPAGAASYVRRGRDATKGAVAGGSLGFLTLGVVYLVATFNPERFHISALPVLFGLFLFLGTVGVCYGTLVGAFWSLVVWISDH